MKRATLWAELYDYESDNSKLTELIANMPKALQKFMSGKEIKRMKKYVLVVGRGKDHQ